VRKEKREEVLKKKGKGKNKKSTLYCVHVKAQEVISIG
jgi:hypothetical protein